MAVVCGAGANRAVGWGLPAWGEWHREHSNPVDLNASFPLWQASQLGMVGAL